MTIDFLGFERLEHPPYSPDLAPMDFAVFPRLKAEMRGYHFRALDELRYRIRTITSGLEKSWYAGIYQKWVERHLKGIWATGEYFEKL